MAELSQRQSSKKQQSETKVQQIPRQSGSSLGGTGGNNSQQKVQSLSKAYAMPTHRRSNTAASFVPTMTLKQFQDQKTAINNTRQKLNQSQVSSFDQRNSTVI